MKDDRFTNLEKDILRSVGRILSSQELNELKHTIFSAMDQVDEITTKTARKMERASRQAHRKYHRPESGKYQHPPKPPRYASTRPPQTEQNLYRHNYPTTYRNLPVKGSAASGLWLAGSICGIVYGTCSTLLSMVTGFIVAGVAASSAVFGSLFVTAASIVSTVFAGKSLGRISRYKKYLKALGGHPLYTVNEISEKSGISAEQVQQDIPKFLKSVSLPFAKLDEQKTCLILDKDTYQQYLDLKENRKRLEEEEAERKARLAADPNAAAVEQMKQDGINYLHKIRLVNDALPEQNISEKLDHLENTCRKIFSYVEQHPNKLPQIRKLMSYYLPMTLKLVESYEQLENHRISSPSIEESKAEIHSALDNINLAFENLFEKLLENDLMDLSADISVLETMLAQEGLTGHGNNLK